MKIALIDTSHANIRSVERALETAAFELPEHGRHVKVVRTSDPEVVLRADKIAVPGQGGFGECVASLRAEGVDEALKERVVAGVPYLGVCLGLQALFESSDEAPGVLGLGLLAGTCRRLQLEDGIKIPHMGWNSLKVQHGGHPALTAAGGNDAWVYFVHSYHAVPEDPLVIKATVQHGNQQVTAAVAKDNVFATQFHPEKSQQVGLSLLSGFLRL